MLDEKNVNRSEGVIIKTLANKGDHRGDNFMVPHEPFSVFGNVDTMHIADILPGAIRGNHYHVDQKEILVVLFKDSWKLGWTAPKSDNVNTRNFNGTGAVLIEIGPHVAHALCNIGKKPMTIVAVYNEYKDRNGCSQTVKQEVL
jgi:dTDP-4-dehydrorhamnose 3,5-epimerase-like enzyme